MNRENLKDNRLLSDIFNALPFMTFIVDADVRILFYNDVAAALLGRDSAKILLKRGGEVMNCVHDREHPEGCGRAESCSRCIIRNSVRKAVEGQKVERAKEMFEIEKGGITAQFPLLVTASPLNSDDRKLCILILEDISELIQLKSMLPICAHCKKIRNDSDYWESVEGYLKSHIIDLEFSHGICPDCARKYYPDYFKDDK